jgi:hypothetical protein
MIPTICLCVSVLFGGQVLFLCGMIYCSHQTGYLVSYKEVILCLLWPIAFPATLIYFWMRDVMTIPWADEVKAKNE